MLVSHLFRIISNSKNTAEKETILWNVLSRQVSKQLGQLWSFLDWRLQFVLLLVLSRWLLLLHHLLLLQEMLLLLLLLLELQRVLLLILLLLL